MFARITTAHGINAEKPLAQPPVIHHIKDFNEDTGRLVFESLGKAIAAGQSVFPLVIDSYGGSVYALISVVEAMRSSPIPVATIIEGKAMSCGAMLAALGTKGMRFIGPHSDIMIHHVSSMTYGIVPQIKTDVKHTEELERRLFEMADLHCGHQPGFFLERLKPLEGADWYIAPEVALSLGIVDHIGIPRLDVHVAATMSLALGNEPRRL